MPARIWLVEYVAEAVQDFQAIEARKERIGVLTVVDKLVALGPSLQPPHVKSLKGEANLMELRPRQGQSPVRPVFARVRDGYKILAIAATKSQLDDAVVTARARAAKYSISLSVDNNGVIVDPVTRARRRRRCATPARAARPSRTASWSQRP